MHNAVRAGCKQSDMSPRKLCDAAGTLYPSNRKFSSWDIGFSLAPAGCSCGELRSCWGPAAARQQFSGYSPTLGQSYHQNRTSPILAHRSTCTTFQQADALLTCIGRLCCRSCVGGSDGLTVIVTLGQRCVICRRLPTVTAAHW